jgi:uncharacterized protein DUF4255
LGGACAYRGLTGRRIALRGAWPCARFRVYRQTPQRGGRHDVGVLGDADRSLADWLGTVLPQGADVRFDAPDPGWVAQPPGPLVVSAVLLDVREDRRGLNSAWSDVRDADGLVIGRQPPVRHFRLSYLVTAWAGAVVSRGEPGGPSQRAIAEHDVLGHILNACAQTEILPVTCLNGALAECELPTAVQCAPADAEDSTQGLWSRFGIAPRACVQLLLIAPLRPPAVLELAPPVREVALNATREDGPTGTARRWERRVSPRAPSRSS